MRTTNIDSFTIMNNIHDTLLSRGILCIMRPLLGGCQLKFPWCDGNAAIYSGTYRNKAGRVETYGFPWDEGKISVFEPDKFVEIITSFYEACTK